MNLIIQINLVKIYRVSILCEINKVDQRDKRTLLLRRDNTSNILSSLIFGLPAIAKR